MPDTAAPRDLIRTFDVEHPDRHIAAPATMAKLVLRHDPTHELPIVVETERGNVVARFALPGDAAIFCAKDRKTLPEPFMRRLLESEPGL